MSFGTRRNTLMEKTGDKKSRDTVPLSFQNYVLLTGNQKYHIS
jgi:hypothetical protein